MSEATSKVLLVIVVDDMLLSLRSSHPSLLVRPHLLKLVVDLLLKAEPTCRAVGDAVVLVEEIDHHLEELFAFLLHLHDQPQAVGNEVCEEKVLGKAERSNELRMTKLVTKGCAATPSYRFNSNSSS